MITFLCLRSQSVALITPHFPGQSFCAQRLNVLLKLFTPAVLFSIMCICLPITPNPWLKYSTLDVRARELRHSY